jgi:hypothetical protein
MLERLFMVCGAIMLISVTAIAAAAAVLICRAMILGG